MRAANEGQANTESSLPDDDGGDGATAGDHAGLDDGGARRCFGVGFELKNFGLKGHGLQKTVDAETGFGRDLHAFGIATPFDRHETDVLKLGFDPHDVGGWQVTFVDRHHDGDVGGLGVSQGFLCLRHDAVVRSNNENDDVGDIGAAGTHP